MSASLLDRELYSYGDVDRLVGLRVGTARRWLNGYRRSGVDYDPVLREDPRAGDAVTWGEMVEARLLAEFRDKRVPVQAMRPAIKRLREEFGTYPLAHANPLLSVAGRELVMKVQEEVSLVKPLELVVVRSGQLVLSDATERFRHAIEYENGRAVSVTPQDRTPDVRMEPEFAFGQPSLRGRQVQTTVLAEDYRAGASFDELADLYDLSVAQVDQAVRFELIASAEHAA